MLDCSALLAQSAFCNKRGGQINDFSRTAPPYLGTYWSKSPGNFSSASTIDAFRDFRKKKNISAQQNAAMRTRTLFKTQYVYLVLLVQSWHVIPFSACTESQESKYDVRFHNQTRQCTLRPFLRPNMYLWCYWSNLGMWYHFPCVFVQSLQAEAGLALKAGFSKGRDRLTCSAQPGHGGKRSDSPEGESQLPELS